MRTRSPRLVAAAAIFTRQLVATERSEATDRHLAMTLAFVAGAMNAGGLIAVGQYTSHMSGIVSAIADNLALGAWGLVGAGATALLSFTGGAAVSAWLINWGRRHRGGMRYALPLLLEAALLAGFGFLGMALAGGIGFAAATIPLLCFVMGLQNATITKVSGARMRTTHVTGIVTDIGIELGKLAYWNRHGEELGGRVRGDRAKLLLLSGLLGAFLIGGVLGALGFSMVGFAAALPPAGLLAILGMAPSVEAALARNRRA